GQRKNIGATNAFLEGGFRVGALTAVFDILKGLIPVVIARHVLGSLTLSNEITVIICGLFAVLGHIFPVFIGFKGGTGLSTSLGALMGIIPDIIFIFIAITILLAIITKRPALMALLMMTAMPFYAYFIGKSYAIITMAAFMSIVYFSVSMTHIGSIMKGGEYEEFSSKLGRLRIRK
ncbi:MAG: glycerol-3-phosphate acyltransferase, partial [bacterium]